MPVLEKPFTPEQLRALLENLVGSGSPTGEIARPHKHVERVPYSRQSHRNSPTPLFKMGARRDRRYIARAVVSLARRHLMSALPSKSDMCGATRDVCFGPIADID